MAKHTNRVKREAHTHKFIKVSGKRVKIWKCADPDCSYLLHIGMEIFLVGKRSICWNCDGPMIMTETNLEQDNPICFKCDAEVQGIEISGMEEFINQQLMVPKKDGDD